MGITRRATIIARGRPRKVGKTRTATSTVCLTEGNGSGRCVHDFVASGFNCSLGHYYSSVHYSCGFSRDYRNAIPRTLVTFLRDQDFRSTVELTISLNNSDSALTYVAKKVTRTFCECEVPCKVHDGILSLLSSSLQEVIGRFVSTEHR